MLSPIPITVPGDPDAATVSPGERAVLTIELVAEAKAAFQLYGRSAQPLLPTPVQVRALSSARNFEVGIVAFTRSGQSCRFFADSFKITRRKPD